MQDRFSALTMKVKLNSRKGGRYVELRKRFPKCDYNFLRTTKYINKTPCNIEYLNAICCFDSETSKINLGTKDCEKWVGWVYQWCMCVGNDYVGLRTITDFMNTLDALRVMYRLEKNKRVMIIYIHNLSYDAVYFLRHMYERDCATELFLLDSRKILTIKYDCFEFRDSYRQSNMSLKKWGENLNTDVRKAVGVVDYDVIRYQDSELTYDDWYYQVNDVATMKECIEVELRENRDTLVTIPLTSTGYVRRDCRRAIEKDAEYRRFFLRTALTEDLYTKMYEAFAGGYCHGNRFFVNRTLTGNIGHRDKKSFYPSEQMMDYFPVSKFEHLYKWESGKELRSYEKFASQLAHLCCLIQIVIINPRIKEGVTATYLQRSKMHGTWTNLKCDNGRILSFDGSGAMWCTELDLETIVEQYRFDNLYITDIYTSKRGEFPRPFKGVIAKYFEAKETLKGVDGSEYFYMKSKNKLNAIFGMSCSRLIRDDIEHDFEQSKDEVVKILDVGEREKRIAKYYNSRKSFFPYQLGVWLTAHCRRELMKLIVLVGYDKFIYSDTDSIFFFWDEETEKRLERYNKEIARRNDELKITLVKKDGSKSYFNLFEDEKDDIKKFRFLHAKCYAFENSKAELYCTIAGVSKDNKREKSDKDYMTNADELECIDNLDADFTFHECGGTVSKYVCNEIEKIRINGHVTEISDACLIFNTDKKISGMETCDFDDMYDYQTRE